MTKDKTGGPAFPNPALADENFCPPYDMSGMTLHDAAVLAALPAVIQVCGRDTCKEGETREQMFARKARGIADAMLAARNEGQDT